MAEANRMMNDERLRSILNDARRRALETGKVTGPDAEK